jgi:hypothetical protein
LARAGILDGSRPWQRALPAKRLQRYHWTKSGERRGVVLRATCGLANCDVVKIGTLPLAVLMMGVTEGNDRDHQLSMTR